MFKIILQRDFLKLATNGQSDKGFLLTSTFVPKGLYTCIKALKYIPGPGVRWAFTGPLVLWYIMHQPFVTTPPHPPSTHPPTENSGDNDFSSITALLKAQHCGELLRNISLLFIIVNSTGVYLHNITSPTLTAGELKRSLPRTLAPQSPAHPRRRGSGYKWLVHNIILKTYP